jgi:hypothetical protein
MEKKNPRKKGNFWQTFFFSNYFSQVCFSFIYLFIYLSFQCFIKMAEKAYILWALLQKVWDQMKTTWDPRSTWIPVSPLQAETFGVWPTRRRKCVYYEGTLNPIWTPLFKNGSPPMRTWDMVWGRRGRLQTWFF